MNFQLLFTIIKADYFQRTRSYNFLITMAVCLWACSYLLPDPSADYVTLAVNGARGFYNSAWVGTATALAINFFISWFGFYLINSTIQRDTATGVGQIIATSQISNFSYLLVKTISNFLLLATLTGVGMFMAVVLFLWRGEADTFNLIDLWSPFFFFELPTIFVVSSLAVLFEVLLPRQQSLANVLYFFFFIFLFTISAFTKNTLFDLVGFAFFQQEIEPTMLQQYGETVNSLVMGGFEPKKSAKLIQWTGLSWQLGMVAQRLLSMLIGLALVGLATLFFKRFDMPPIQSTNRKNWLDKLFTAKEKTVSITHKNLRFKDLTPITPNFSILPLWLTELKIMLKGNSIWWFLLTLGLWVAIIFTPLEMAHLYVLPALFLCQLPHFSDLGNKELSLGTELYVFSAYNPLIRLFVAKLLAAYVWAVVLTLPLAARYLILGEIDKILAIISGAMFPVALAFALSAWTNTSKLYEILLIFISYALFNGATFCDYLGGLPANEGKLLWVVYLAINIGLVFAAMAGRKKQMMSL